MANIKGKNSSNSDLNLNSEATREATSALSQNIRLLEDAENRGKRFCPECGSRMRTCCDLHRQLNLKDHRPNCIHEGPEQWICLNCGLIEYKDLAMRIMCGRAGRL